MTVEQARELLGPNYSNLTDEQIQEIMSLIRAICRHSIRNVCKSQVKGNEEATN